MSYYTTTRAAGTAVTGTGDRTGNVTWATTSDREAETVTLVLTYWDKPFSTDGRRKLATVGEDRITVPAMNVSDLVKDLTDAMYFAVAKDDA